MCMSIGRCIATSSCCALFATAFNGTWYFNRRSEPQTVLHLYSERIRSIHPVATALYVTSIRLLRRSQRSRPAIVLRITRKFRSCTGPCQAFTIFVPGSRGSDAALFASRGPDAPRFSNAPLSWRGYANMLLGRIQYVGQAYAFNEVQRQYSIASWSTWTRGPLVPGHVHT